jgi:glycosyltransferase involved in cell wall biosynthesis
MKLLFVVERLGVEGGMERFLQIVLPALVSRGIDLRVVARRVDTVPAAISAEHIDWADEHDPPDAAAAAAVRRVVEEFGPDAIVAQNVMDTGIVEALRGPARLTYHLCDHRPFCPNGDRVFPRSGTTCNLKMGLQCALHTALDGCAYGPRPRSLGLISRRMRLRDAVATADVVLVGSPYMRESASANGIARERIREVRYPLPDDAYGDRPTPTTAPRVVLFAGRLVPQKGLRSLVRALASIPAEQRPILRAFGEGPEAEPAAAEAAGLGVRLELGGVATAPELYRALDECTLVAMPSLWAEPFGRVGIEAFARERPVVAYDVGGVRSWLVDGVNGFAVPPGDELALGAAVGRLLKEDGLRARLGMRARIDAEQYRLAPFLDALLGAVAPTPSVPA